MPGFNPAFCYNKSNRKSLLSLIKSFSTPPLTEDCFWHCRNLYIFFPENGGKCAYTAGHVLGGGSSINAMNYVRGNKYDYDSWRDEGNEGWGYDDVLPYFLKSEDIKITELSTSKYHAKGGGLTIDRSRYHSLIEDDLIEAGAELGYQYGDYNGENQNTISYLQYTMRDGARCSAAKAFLAPAKNRTNLHISKRTVALKVNLNDRRDRVRSVVLLKDGEISVVKAEKEVILSAGAIHSPKVLMLSGIGPKDHLTQVGVDCKIDLPVGERLYDHLMITTRFKINASLTVTKDDAESMKTMWQYIREKSGPLSATFCEVAGHFAFNVSDDKPDVQMMIGSTASFLDEHVLTGVVTKVQPKSVGNIKLRSPDPFDSPLIDPRYLEHPDDVEDTLKGCKLLLDFMRTEALSKYGPEIYASGTVCQGKEDLDYCKCLIENESNSMYHPSGTARMSGDCKDGVVNSKLQVCGVDNLRVIDNSIMPKITSGNTNAAAIMIGEKGSDLIKSYWEVPSD